MIKVNNLSKEFHEQGTSNELLAVDHVDFTIQNGSFCALVGESGSGKRKKYFPLPGQTKAGTAI